MDKKDNKSKTAKLSTCLLLVHIIFFKKILKKDAIRIFPKMSIHISFTRSLALNMKEHNVDFFNDPLYRDR